MDCCLLMPDGFAVSNVVVLNYFLLFSVELSWRQIDLLSMIADGQKNVLGCQPLIVLSNMLFI